MWLDDIPFLDDPPFLHNDLYGHETTAKLKLVNRSLQQYIMLGGVRVLGRGARAVSLKCYPNVTPGLPGLVKYFSLDSSYKSTRSEFAGFQH